MWEDKFDVYEDMLGDGKIVKRLAADMDIEDAVLFMKAFVQEYYNETQLALILKHSSVPREEVE